MCELLGLSLKAEDTPRISFRAFRSRAEGDSPSTRNRDGWGIAWYPDGRAAAVFKEAIPANTSPLTSFIGQYERFRSRTFIAHVRRASRGGVAYRNTHPFCRELHGREYTFAHNGTLRGAEVVDTGTFRPVGETDSERLFCYILSVIHNLGGISSETCVQLWDALLSLNQLSSNGTPSKINLLLSDGDTLVAYQDMFSKGTLYQLERPEHYSEEVAVLEDGDYRIEFSAQKGETQRAAVIATKRLTNERGWRKFEPGQLCAFQRGRLIFSSASALEHCGVEVYDSSTWLDQRSEAPYVVGMPVALRNSLGVTLGDTVSVSNGQKRVELKVYRTDKKLLSGGSCCAVSPDSHICLPSRIRRRLGLVRTGLCRSTPGFTRIYTPVSIRPV